MVKKWIDFIKESTYNKNEKIESWTISAYWSKYFVQFLFTEFRKKLYDINFEKKLENIMSDVIDRIDRFSTTPILALNGNISKTPSSNVYDNKNIDEFLGKEFGILIQITVEINSSDLLEDFKQNINMFSKIYTKNIKEKIKDIEILNIKIKDVLFNIKSNIGKYTSIEIILITDEKFENPNDWNISKKLIDRYPEAINSFYYTHDKRKILDHIKRNPSIINSLTGQLALDFAKYKDKKNKTKISKSDTFVFIAKEVFKEDVDGKYYKDIEIENLYKIDSFDINSHAEVNLMKIRANSQMADGSKLYFIRTERGLLSKDQIKNINKPEYRYIRNMISGAMKPV